MKIQLVGPISGTADYHEHFRRDARKLKEAGYTVFNPTALWPNACRPPCPEGCRFCPTHEEAMAASLRFLTMEAAGLALMDGWEQSKGACFEEQMAQMIGVMVRMVDEWLAWAG